MNDFYEISKILSRWSSEIVPSESFSDNSCERLRKALFSIQANEFSIGSADLAGLIKHTLSRYTLLQKENHKLKVPKMNGWPTKQQWIDFGFQIQHEAENSYLITSEKQWTPDWLPLSEKFPPLHDALLEKKRRIEEYLPSDPCVQETVGFKYYLSTGQRQAVRSVFNSKSDSTLLINLPTGSGKSLISWLPSFLYGSEANLTLVIVPTISLALDQERQMNALLKNKLSSYSKGMFAWYGGRSEHEKALIKQQIQNGTQQILFTSPESLVGSLAYSIYNAAQKGYLSNFIVDEVHLVSQWGNEFRPHFQAISGIRRDLLNRCPSDKHFRTILMTATLTEDSIQTINVLFGPADNVEIISSIHLRPEPSYWIFKAENNLDKEIKVSEIINNSPRPIILYVTRREDAEMWYNLLKKNEYQRLEYFHGRTNSQKREKIIHNWINNNIDIIVATSAFGVGMDKSNIRTIIHACVPENVDRFYQEVGRGGRDGKASLSFLVYSDEDLEIAKDLSKDKIIGQRKGLLRWKSMLSSSQYVDGKDDCIKVKLNERPPHILGEGDSNTSWNVRTLILMARSGLIEIESDAPPIIEMKEGESENSFEVRRQSLIQKYFNECVVRILIQGHDEEDVWDRLVESERLRVQSENRNNYLLVKKLLSGYKEIAKIFENIYSIPEFNVCPILVCGGCNICRQNNMRYYNYSKPESFPISKNLVQFSTEKFMKEFGSESELGIITYTLPYNTEREYRKWQRQIIELLRLIIPRFGIVEIAAESKWKLNKEFMKLYKNANNHFIIFSDISEELYYTDINVPRITIIEPAYPQETLSKEIVLLSRPINLIVTPDITPGFHDLRLLIDTYPHTTIDKILRGT